MAKDSFSSLLLIRMVNALIFFLLIQSLIDKITIDCRPTKPGRVDVQIYDHRAYHDPIDKYGKGPWHFFSHGYGLNYQYEPDMSYQRERGYEFEKGFMRDLCDGMTRPCDTPDGQPLTISPSSGSYVRQLELQHFPHTYLHSDYE